MRTMPARGRSGGPSKRPSPRKRVTRVGRSVGLAPGRPLGLQVGQRCWRRCSLQPFGSAIRFCRSMKPCRCSSQKAPHSGAHRAGNRAGRRVQAAAGGGLLTHPRRGPAHRRQAARLRSSSASATGCTPRRGNAEKVDAWYPLFLSKILRAPIAGPGIRTHDPNLGEVVLVETTKICSRPQFAECRDSAGIVFASRGGAPIRERTVSPATQIATERGSTERDGNE
jgi:hypothetical protein